MIKILSISRNQGALAVLTTGRPGPTVQTTHASLLDFRWWDEWCRAAWGEPADHRISNWQRHVEYHLRQHDAACVSDRMPTEGTADCPHCGCNATAAEQRGSLRCDHCGATFAQPESGESTWYSRQHRQRTPLAEPPTSLLGRPPGPGGSYDSLGREVQRRLDEAYYRGR